ncbi:MAG: hypothetical protein ACO21H_07135 [Sediminibacterium sp.]
MAFNGSGTFTRIYNWVIDKANSIPITASRMDGELDGIAAGLSNCITKDGQTTITANIPFANYKITGLGNGTTRSDAINAGQVQDNQFLYLGTTSGSADAYTLAPSPAITAYAATQQFTAKINATNTTTTPYLQLSGIANPTTTAVIKKLSATKTEIAVAIGDLVANGIYTFQRNSANNAWIVLELSNPATTTSQGVAYLLPNRNILINGAMAIDQRNAGASQTITAGSALAYTVDRWYAYCTGANATGQRVAGTAPNQYNYRFTGASSVTKIGFAQRIEASNSQHLAGKTATLSVDLANSLLTTITWTAWYANTSDTFGTLASPTRTQIATGTFTVNSTLTRYSTSIAIPAGATTGIEIELSVGAQTSGTWTIGRAQLEDTPEQTTFEYRSTQHELLLCQRYYEYGITWGVSYGASASFIQRCLFPYKVNKRTSNPSISVSVLSGLLTSAGVVDINQYNAWIGFASSVAGAEGSFGITINSEL